MANSNLNKAQSANQDEFYTHYADIEQEVLAYVEYNPDVFRGKTILLPCDDPEWSNFTRFFARRFSEFGIRKLISTSYAPDAKRLKQPYEPTLFETDAPQFDPKKAQTHGKIFVLERDVTGDGVIDDDDLEWQYLDGDGDFRSDEVTRLRDEADVIVTNPPFSLFREFFDWLMAGEKSFLIIGNQNNIAYKNVFPYMKSNQVWWGTHAGSQEFRVPAEFERDNTYVAKNGKKYAKFGNICWFTNIDHGLRHQPLELMTMAENLKFAKHKDLKGLTEYHHYYNYDAIEVPAVKCIPSDYDGAMGVPVSFFGSYCPDQFEILGTSLELADMNVIKNALGKLNGGPRLYIEQDGALIRKYERILIRKKK